MSSSNGKHRRRPAQSPTPIDDGPPIDETPEASPVIAPPPVAEAAADVDASEALPPPEIPETTPSITAADRISCGKVIARKLGRAPAACQEIAAGLSDDQVRGILALQLQTDPASEINAILGS